MANDSYAAMNQKQSADEGLAPMGIAGKDACAAPERTRASALPVILIPHSAIRNFQSAIRNPQSAILLLLLFLAALLLFPALAGAQGKKGGSGGRGGGGGGSRGGGRGGNRGSTVFRGREGEPGVSPTPTPSAPSENAPAKALEALGDPNPTVRVGAMRDLARYRSAAAVEALINALDEPDPADPAAAHQQAWVRQEAAQALEKIGTAARAAIPALVRRLDDPNAAVHAAVIRALRVVGPGDPRSLAGLIESMEDHGPHEGSFDACMAVLLEWPVTPETIKAYLSALRAAARASGGGADRGLVGNIIDLSGAFIDRLGPEQRDAAGDFTALGREPQLALKRIAVAALVRLGEVPEEFIPTLMGYAFGIRADSGWAVEALVALGPRAAPVAPKLVGVLESRDWTRAQSALRILNAIGRPAAEPAIPVLERFVLDGTLTGRLDSKRVVLLCESLLTLDPGSAAAREALERVTELTRNVDPNSIDLQAQGALLKAGSDAPRRLKVLREALASTNDRRRAVAAQQLLRRSGNTAAREAAATIALKLLNQSRERSVMEAARDGLQTLGSGDAAVAPLLGERVGQIVKWLGETDRRDTEDLRVAMEEAIALLGRMGPAAGGQLPLLRGLLRDGLPETKVTMEMQLLHLATSKNFSLDDNLHFRKHVAEVIARIEGKE